MTDGKNAGPVSLYGFDARVAHPARVYDYWLGGKDNFAADRIAGEETIAAYPAIRASARANRAFLARSVRYLATEAGIRQFLDIGTGLPTASNTHEVAQSIAPDSRIVYVTMTVASRVVHTHAGPLGLPEAYAQAESDQSVSERSAARCLACHLMLYAWASLDPSTP